MITKKLLRKFKVAFILLIIFFGLSVFNSTFAYGVSGYAWSNNAGWINFGVANGSADITDSGITGHVWNEIYGWINMAPANSGVEVSSSGALSGSAWGQNVGWIDFSSTSINCSGQFIGTATGNTIGTITFNCTNCNVTTSYRPQSCGTGGGGPPKPECGNGICTTEFENCMSCPKDCGACSLNISCFGSPNPALTNQNITFSSSVSGGTGSYVYSWTGDCQGTNANCEKSFALAGNYNASLSVASGGETKFATCSVAVNASPPPPPPSALNISCFGSPNPALTNQNITFSSSVSGGTGSYVYSWTGDCQGTNANCAKSFADLKVYNAILNVVSGSQVKATACSVNVISPPPPPMLKKHNICIENQCVTVEGLGENQCQIQNDCKQITPPPPPIIPPIIPKIISQITPPIIPPLADIITKIITTTGLIVVLLTTAFASPMSLAELFLLPTRLMGLILIAFGWKKRNPPWGVVYDSVTKQPLDPAYVILKDLNNKDISSAITDLDGRYGFLIEPGNYKMSANKTNYIFPSQKLAGKINDELYDNLYFGAPVEIKDRNEIITRNIPLDPLKFDWNEFAKQKRSLTKFYSRWDSLVREISDLIYAIGFVVAVIAFFVAPYPYNTIILGLYLILLLLRILGLKPRPFGSVVDKITGEPLTFAIIRVADPSSNIEISQKITDKYGRYFCLVPKGKYYVKVEKKNNDSSYSLVYTSPVIDTSRNGIIKNKFRV